MGLPPRASARPQACRAELECRAAVLRGRCVHRRRGRSDFEDAAGRRRMRAAGERAACDVAAEPEAAAPADAAPADPAAAPADPAAAPADPAAAPADPAAAPADPAP